jgi:hypothetical protein
MATTYYEFMASAAGFASSSASIGQMQSMMRLEARANLGRQLDRLSARCARALKDDFAECFVAGTQVVYDESDATATVAVAANYDRYLCLLFVGVGLVGHEATRRRRRRQVESSANEVDRYFAHVADDSDTLSDQVPVHELAM